MKHWQLCLFVNQFNSCHILKYFIPIRSCIVHVYQINDEKQVKTGSDIILDAPPCVLSVDYGNRLWVVQSNKQQTIIVFKIKCDDGKYEVCCVLFPHSRNCF